eukprot:TRINITY_DN64633_c0_g1_i1.p1 TRINITY_DN64633_c0_g1~~TRINITY_DN64633_c0_g1_i1.p1  ORF type:complete len:417 (-),score=24.43 TRINITY_DN64633_c0_g1_i1:683-1933(-)
MKAHPQVLVPNPALEEHFFFKPQVVSEHLDLNHRFSRSEQTSGKNLQNSDRLIRGIHAPMMILHDEAMDAFFRVSGARAIVLVRDPIERIQSYFDGDYWPEWARDAYGDLNLMQFEQSHFLMRPVVRRLAADRRLLLVPINAVKHVPSLVLKAVTNFLGIAPFDTAASGTYLQKRNPTYMVGSQKLDVCSRRAGLEIHALLVDVFALEYASLTSLLRRFFYPFVNMTGGRKLTLDDQRSRTSWLTLAPMVCRRRRITTRSQSSRIGSLLRGKVCERGLRKGCFNESLSCEKCCFGDSDECPLDGSLLEACCEPWKLNDFVECSKVRRCLETHSLREGSEAIFRAHDCVTRHTEWYSPEPGCLAAHDVITARRNAAHALLVDALCAGLSPGGCCIKMTRSTLCLQDGKSLHASQKAC